MTDVFSWSRRFYLQKWEHKERKLISALHENCLAESTLCQVVRYVPSGVQCLHSMYRMHCNSLFRYQWLVCDGGVNNIPQFCAPEMTLWRGVMRTRLWIYPLRPNYARLLYFSFLFSLDFSRMYVVDLLIISVSVCWSLCIAVTGTLSWNKKRSKNEKMSTLTKLSASAKFWFHFTIFSKHARYIFSAAIYSGYDRLVFFLW